MFLIIVKDLIVSFVIVIQVRTNLIDFVFLMDQKFILFFVLESSLFYGHFHLKKQYIHNK